MEENTEMLLLEYRNTVRRLLETGSSAIIDNSSPRHASIIIEEMIRHAKVSFSAFAGRMNQEVWNMNVMAALESAVRRGVLVQLLVEKNCEPVDSSAVPQLVGPTVRKCDENVLASIGKVSHCAIGDGQSLRIEMDAEKKTAAFTANNPSLAGRALDIFRFLYSNGTRYAAA